MNHPRGFHFKIRRFSTLPYPLRAKKTLIICDSKQLDLYDLNALGGSRAEATLVRNAMPTRRSHSVDIFRSKEMATGGIITYKTIQRLINFLQL